MTSKRTGASQTLSGGEVTLHPASPRRLGWVAAICIFAFLVPVYGRASAADGPKGWGDLGIRLKTKTVSTEPNRAVAATARCPRGTKVIAGGAYLHEEGDPPSGTVLRLGATAPLLNKRGWYATAWHNLDSYDVLFTVNAVCAKGVSYTIREADSRVLLNQTAGGYIGCLSGETALGGGAYFHDGDGVPSATYADRSYVSSSSVTHDRLNWYVHGYHTADSARYMRSRVICTTTPLEETTLGQVVVEDVPTGTATEFRGALCPENYKVITGGSFWSNDPGGPTADEAGKAFITGSSPYEVTRWLGYGVNSSLAGGDLVVRAVCVPK